MNVADTIIAIGSPPGRSQRTLLRLAGPDAFRVCDITIRFVASGHPFSSSEVTHFQSSDSSHQVPTATPATT